MGRYDEVVTPPPRPTAPPPGGRPRLAAGLAVALACNLATLALVSTAPARAVVDRWWPSPSSPTPAPTAPTASGGPRPEQTTGAVAMTDALRRGVVIVEGAGSDEVSAGTGLVLTADGFVLTNYHVVESSHTIHVTLGEDGRRVVATLAGRDAARDVALLAVRGVTGLATVTLDDDPVAVGDVVVAAGNARGEGRLLAHRGNVLALDQRVTVPGDDDADPGEEHSGMIRSSAPGFPGDSGGPLFDAEGEVLGVTTAGSDDGGGRDLYAIPIAEAVGIADQIRAGDESGTVVIGPRALLGVLLAAPEASEAGLEVTSIVPDSPAAAVGIKAGDRLLEVAGRPVTTRGRLIRELDEFEPAAEGDVEWRTSSGRDRTAPGQVN